MKKVISFVVSMCLATTMLSGQNAPHNPNEAVVSPASPIGEFAVSRSYQSYHRSFNLQGLCYKQANNNGIPVINPAHQVRQCLDSIIGETFDPQSSLWETDYKKNFSYDAAGKITEYLCQKWNALSHSWIPKTKSNYYYNNAGNLTLFVQCRWDDITGQWIGEYREEISYDLSGNISQHIYYHWETGTSSWVGSVKNGFSFDTEGKITEYTYSEWDRTRSQWTGDFKEQFQYDSNGNLTLYYYFGWDPILSQWVKHHKSEYSYDSSGNVTSYTYCVWNNTSNLWCGEYKHEYQYDANGNILQDIYLIYDSGIQQWEPSTKKDYLYDASGNLAQMVFSQWQFGGQWMGIWKEEYEYSSYGYIMTYRYYIWNENTNQWVLDLKKESLWDTHGNLLQREVYNWNPSASQWVGDAQQIYIYNHSYPIASLIVPFWLAEEIIPFKHMLLGGENLSWDQGTSSWIYTDRFTLFWSAEVPNGINELANATTITVFPNPASDYLKIDLEIGEKPALFELFSTEGKLVLKQALPDDNRIEVTNLENGCYFYRVIGQATTASGTLMIR